MKYSRYNDILLVEVVFILMSESFGPKYFILDIGYIDSLDQEERGTGGKERKQ